MAVVDHTVYPASSQILVIAGCIAFLSGVAILISFSSPYWFESWGPTHSQFKNLGLWEFCFEDFRFPQYQYDKSFNGCHHVYSEEYLVVRQWLMPGWFMFVQAMMCLALIFSLLCLIAISIVIMRFLLRWEWYTLLTASVLSSLTALPLTLSVIVFGCMCWSRSWLPYPNWNTLSWGFALATAAGFFYIVVTILLLVEMGKAKDRKREVNNIMYKTESTSSYRY